MYTLAIIGAGSIGALKDDRYDSKDSKNILTQAHAAYKHSSINLMAVCDLDQDRAYDAAEKWDTIAYTNYIKMIEETKPDIISLCVPTAVHDIIMKELLNFSTWKPKLVICEKPFCESAEKAQEIHDLYEISDLYKKLNVPILIDYIRRFDKHYHDIRDKIADSIIYSVRVTYNRGLQHEGCHAVDLLNFLLGDCRKIKNLTNREDYIIDRNSEDPTIMVRFWYKRCKNVIFFPVDGRVASIFEIDIVTSKGRFQLIDHGKTLAFWPVQKETTYGNYNSFSPMPVCQNTDLTTALYGLMNNAVEFLDGREPLYCTDADALRVHEIIKQIGRA